MASLASSHLVCHEMRDGQLWSQSQLILKYFLLILAVQCKDKFLSDENHNFLIVLYILHYLII